jgi:hypothetical protein
VNAGSAARHYTSHRSVLKPPPDGQGGDSVDAIVMPAARTAVHLLPGMQLAEQLGCEFVALCSGQTQVKEAVGLAREVPGLSWTLVELEEGWTSQLLDFRTARFEAATSLRCSDLSTKRNIGLLLARMVGWHRILFLDDDIRVDAELVRTAAATLRPGRATGMPALEFPDNSVVSHALRAVDIQQDVFVSGSALLVDTTRIDSFFPDVYNEDWFFLFDAVRLGQVCSSGEVSQEKYDPFADPRRAVREEFGDVLAEGLMSLLHYAGGKGRALTDKYWDAVLDQRRALLGSIVDLLEASPQLEAPAAAAAVKAAAIETAGFTGALLARYVRQWQRDVRLWRSRIQSLAPEPSLEAALRRLRLPHLTVRSGQLEQEAFLGPDRVPVEGLAQSSAAEPDSLVEPGGADVVVEHPQPDPADIVLAKVGQHLRQQLRAEAAAAGRRSDPEVAEIAILDGNVAARRRAQKRLNLRRVIIFRADQPDSERQLGVPARWSVSSLLGERGQKRRRRLSQGVESR